jgi:hypothetical protein
VVRFRNPCRIASLALSSNESSLAVAVPPGHVYTLAFGSLEILKLEDDNFEPLAGMDLPSGQLTGMNIMNSV